MILVIAEQQQGKLNRASWEAIAAAQQVAAGAMPVKVAVAGQNVAAVAAELAQAAVAEVLTVDSPALAVYTPDGFGKSPVAAALDKLLKVPLTARNWNTVLKLQEMAEAAATA